MRCALCIHGYFSNKDDDDLQKTSYIKNNIINNLENVDIFFHSFDSKNKLKILKKYPNCKKYIIENQIDFNRKMNKKNVHYLNKLIDNNYSSKSYNLYSTLSFLYSRKKSIQLALKYSKDNKVSYDAIIACRFDLGIRIKKVHLGCNPGKFIFNPADKYNFNYIYSAFWKQLNAGYADHWFFSNPINMEILSNMYDYVLEKCFILNSHYLNTLKNWPDSDKMSQTSNEILQNNTNDKLLINIPFVNSANNHILHKFYFIKSKLYEKSKFLDFTNI